MCGKRCTHCIGQYTKGQVSKSAPGRKTNDIETSLPPVHFIRAAHCGGASCLVTVSQNSWTWSEFMAVHPSWWHSVTTWCWSENLNSYTLSPAVLTLCAESDLWQATVSSDGRRAHVMCLIYCIALYLLQAIEAEEPGRRTGRWNREEGVKVANLLGERSLIKTLTSEGRV